MHKIQHYLDMSFTVHVVTVDCPRLIVAALCFISFFPDSTYHVLVPIDAHEALVIVVLENILVKKSPVGHSPCEPEFNPLGQNHCMFLRPVLRAGRRGYVRYASTHSLVLLEHEGGVVAPASLSALAAATQVGKNITGVVVGGPEEVKAILPAAKRSVGTTPL
jgi:hypothetical protein